MANITFSLPDAKIDAIVDVFCVQEGYQSMIWENDISVPNPETKIQFTKRRLREIMKRAYVNYQAEQARLAAASVADGEV